jgi:hypothetical protein
MVYRFRVTYEDHEDVYRDIEIRSTQTFDELHRAIQESIGFDNSKAASFFMSDDQLRRGTEIRQSGPEERSKDANYMHKSKLVNFIDDPHQKILYIFDPAAEWTFALELMKVMPEDDKGTYPKCVKSVGNAPKQYKVTTLPPPEEEEDELEDAGAKEKIFSSEEKYDAVVPAENEAGAETGTLDDVLPEDPELENEEFTGEEDKEE